MSLNNEFVTEYMLLVNRDEICRLIYQFDKFFIKHVTEKENFSSTLDKIINHGIVICAMQKEKIIGYCAFYMNDFVSKTIYISLLVVDEALQGKSVGTNIIEYIKKLGKINGFKKIRLEVDLNNKKGIRFYHNNNFIVAGKASDESNYMELLF